MTQPSIDDYTPVSHKRFYEVTDVFGVFPLISLTRLFSPQISPPRTSTPARKPSQQRRVATSPARRPTTGGGRGTRPTGGPAGGRGRVHEYMEQDDDRTDVRAEDYMRIGDSYELHVWFICII